MIFSKKERGFVLILSGVLLAVKLLCAPVLIALFLRHTTFSRASSIGIIGGADGPTQIFVGSSPLPAVGAALALCFLADAALLVFLLVKAIRALRKKDK